MNIASLRFKNQQLTASRFSSPTQLVRWFGAVQAQEYLPSQWAIGQRLTKEVTDDIVKQALMDREIVRTWPMRGTIHYVPAEDAGWMTALTARRINEKYTAMFTKMGITQPILDAAKPILTSILGTGNHLIRAEIYSAFEEGGIPNAKKFGPFILSFWAQEGLICFGIHREKQPTFTLLSTWATSQNSPSTEEALSILARRYFQSHSPATLHDFAWWGGITVKEARHGIECLGSFLKSYEVDSRQYFAPESLTFTEHTTELPSLLLPCFDEYTVAYKDRSAAVDSDKLVQYGYGVNWNNIIIDGRIAGAWKRTVKKDEVLVELQPVRALSKKELDTLTNEADRFARFIQSSQATIHVSSAQREVVASCHTTAIP